MERFADSVSWKSRRALAERTKDRRVRARHTSYELASREEQIPRHQGLRRQACGPHRPAGSRRRSLFPEYQDSPPVKCAADIEIRRLKRLGASMKKESLDRRDFLKQA